MSRPVARALLAVLAGTLACAGGCAPPTPRSPDTAQERVETIDRLVGAVVDGLETRLGARVASPGARGAVACAVGERYAVDLQLRGFVYLDDPRSDQEVTAIEEVLDDAGLTVASDPRAGPGPGAVVGTLGDVRVAVSAPPGVRVAGGSTRALRGVAVYGRCAVH